MTILSDILSDSDKQRIELKSWSEEGKAESCDCLTFAHRAIRGTSAVLIAFTGHKTQPRPTTRVGQVFWTGETGAEYDRVDSDQIDDPHSVTGTDCDGVGRTLDVSGIEQI